MQELAEYYAGADDAAYLDENRYCLEYYYAKLADAITHYHPKRGRIFDVGCSRGWFFGSLQGWECYGSEIAQSDAKIAQKCFGDHIYAGAFETYIPPKEAFDAVTFQDMLDHFINPVGALKKAYDMLAVGGIIAVKVHDFDCIYARITGPNFYAVLPPGHLFYFSRKSLQVLLRSIGFDLLGLRHIGHLLQLSTVFQRLAKGKKEGLWYTIGKVVRSIPIGKIRVYKNLHDIMTIFARKT
jgi:SAM-dependent methyltransferase